MLQVDVESAGVDSAFADEVLQSLAHPLLVVDEGGRLIYANASAQLHLGHLEIGQPIEAAFPDYTRPVLDGQGGTAIRLTSAGQATFSGLCGRISGEAMSLSLWPATPGDALTVQVDRDDLTGLVKRNDFAHALSSRLAAPGSHGVAILCIDLDRFKTINDTLGHGIGDELLRKVAERLMSACRKEDIVARLGGDEFAILQCGVSQPEEARKLADRVVDLLGRTYVLNGHTINIGASVGIAQSEPSLQARDLLRNADVALYEAKRAGRNRSCVFEAHMAASLRERRELEIDLRRAIALRQLELHYQPFVDVTDSTVKGFEALLRWHHPVRGNIPPLSFIPLAEENGLILKIGDWVIRTACHEAARWGEELVIAVNVSPLQFKTETLVATVASALQASGLPAQRLELEITEGALLDDTEKVLVTLHALRDLGVRISMDDFGTGYSSLSYLRKFPFDKIKVDRSFVVNSDIEDRAVLTAVSSLGSVLGMQITAEGVETAEQFERVRSEACTHVQGYLTGRPLSADRIPEFLRKPNQGEHE